MERRKFIQLSSKSTVALSTLPFHDLLSITPSGLVRDRSDSTHLKEMKSWDIMVDRDAGPCEKYAAAEFQRIFKSITGAQLKAGAVPGVKKAVYIGESAVRQSPFSDFEIPAKGEEGFRIKVSKGLLLIGGAHPRGTLYGVYEFFERYIGVRFLTKDHTHIPSDASEVPVPFVDFNYEPSFFFRWPYYQENFDDPAFAVRLRANTISSEERLGGKTSQGLITHSILDYLPVSVYGKTHPEYFALVDGVRKLDVGGGGPQVCSTNSEVIRIITEGVSKVLDADPSLTNISVSQMDNNAICECPFCSALGAKEESEGAPHLALVNAVAESIAVSHPGVKIGTLVYWYSRKPPKYMTLLPNVQIMLCSIECCTFHPLDDPLCSRNKLFCEDLDRWKNICKNILIWNYNTNFTAYDLPFPNFNTIGKNVRLFQENGVQGVFMQAAGNGLSAEMSDLRNYVMAQCLWNPEKESWELVEEFCRLHYGPAASSILEYLHYLHRNAMEREVHPNCFPKASEVGLDFEVSQKIHAFFQEALKSSSDITIRNRVEKSMIPALRSLLVTAPLIYKNERYTYDDPFVSEQVFDQYKSLTKKFSMNRVAENKLTIDYINEIEAVKKGLPAILLENKIWSVLVFPEQKGRIAQVLHKPSGNSLVNKPKAEEAGITSAKETKNTWRYHQNRVFVTREFKDGSVWQRIISLPGDKDEIRITTEYTAGQQKSGWEVRERPCLFRISGSEDPKLVSVYTKSPDWNQGNLDWQFDREIIFQRLLRTDTACTSFAFYDHSKHYGISQNFDRDTFRRFFLFWHPGRKELGMEMCTPLQTLQEGQKLSFSYGIGFLKGPCVNNEELIESSAF
ncbi:DUF4838 domain-containing protein [Agriterribacter sp.]|uniref:DUF4838 domain-containing protein n=1 Tax=Agriterribacter sp. TaxID=2821509 RepID=UPI002C6CCF33|nr:DUF4838 domain-containing protein [Agriterribacter sp.]HRP55318.1 DUF4838 domain-containing protein [Agriterribacter sp.]